MASKIQTQPPAPPPAHSFLAGLLKGGAALLGLAVLSILIGQSIDVDIDIGHIKTGVHCKGSVLLNLRHQPGSD